MGKKNKILGIFSLLVIFFNITAIPANALSIQEQVPEENFTNIDMDTRSIMYSKSQQEFIENVELNENISIKDDNVDTIINPDNTVSIIVTHDDGFDIFSSEDPVLLQTQALQPYYNDINDVNDVEIPYATSSLTLKGLVYLYKIYSKGKAVCEILKRFSNGGNPCAVIGQELMNNLSSTRKTKFVVTRYFKKLKCPYPPNSYQCSSPPYGYWATTVKRA